MPDAFSFQEDGTIVVTHVAGFFSCCAIRLKAIIGYFNTHGCRLPKRVDSREQWRWYRAPSFDADKDMAFEYFVHYDDMPNVFPPHRVFYDHEDQFVDYRILSYDDLRPFIHKYFSPSPSIQSLVDGMVSKYTIDYDNTCVLFYRGNDKVKETTLCEYSEMFQEADALIQKHPNCRLLIQSDETEFLQEAVQRYPQRAFVLGDEIRHMRRNPMTTVDAGHPAFNAPFSKNFLAITWMMSKCRWIVCTSGNCSVFIMYYRGHAINVRQNLNGEWLGLLQ